MPLLTTKEREEFGFKVRQARRKLNISPSQVASKIACPLNVINSIEIGLQTSLNEAGMKELCDLLKISMPY